MREIQFTKMHGLGNNYVYINTFEEKLAEEELPSLAEALANIYTGIGSDGMILICPSDQAPVKMRIFNKDGSEGRNCGNGLRCVAKYAYEHKIVSEKIFHIETLSGIVQAEVFEENGIVNFVSVDMGAPIFEAENIPVIGETKQSFDFEGQRYESTSVSMGNPHTVFFVEDIEQAPLRTLGPIVEKHKAFPEGVNVEFIQVISDKKIAFKVWERGSGVTQACGTGACAAAVVAVLHHKVKKGEEIVVHLEGGDLFITWNHDDRVIMKGEAKTICQGIFYWN